MSYASGDSPLTLGHYICIHCQMVHDVVSTNDPLPPCRCPEGKGDWVERPKDAD